MKALTLTQPYATLIALGQKKIETRSWSTSYRGPLAIHAGKGPGKIGWMQMNHICNHTEPFKSVLADLLHGQHPGMVLPLGAIVATCSLEGCVDTFFLDLEKRVRVTGFDGERRYWNLTDQERAFGDYTPGRFAWLLADVKVLPEPIPCKGALSLWECVP